MDYFKLFTPISYWILSVLWFFILIFYVNRIVRRNIKSQLFITLLIILAIDAFRTLFESVYFGAWYTSLVGFIPESIHDFLVRPENVFIPKALNLIAAILIIFIVLRRWIPEEEEEREKERNYLIKLEKEVQERKLSQKLLAESEERFKGIFNYSTSGIAIYETSNNGNDFVFKDLNKAVENIEKTKKSELVGKNVLEVFPGVKDFGLLDIFKRVWETGTPEYHPVSIYQDDRIIGWRENFIYKLPSGEIVAVYSDETEHKRAEQALLESEQKYRTLFESSIDPLFLIDANTGCIDSNESAVKLYQIESRQKFIGLSPRDFSPKFQPNEQASQELYKEYIKEAHQEGSAEFEWVYLKRDGTEFPALVTLSAMKVQGKDVVLAFNKDLSEMKDAAAKREELIIELQETLATLKRYERIIASTPDFISLIDRNFVYRLVNDAYLKVFNKEKEEILNKSLASLLGQEFFDKNSKPYLDRAFCGETVTVDQTLSLPGKRSLHLAVTYHPVKSKDGSIDFVSLNARDVTKLKSFSDRLDLATDAGKIGIWEWDLLTNDLIWDETMLGLYKVQLDEFNAIYDTWRSRVHPEDIERAEAELAEAIEKIKDFNSEFRIIWPDGKIRHIKAAARIITNNDGKATLMIGVNSDSTQMRELESELRIQATTDSLTGANNRRYFMDRAEEEFARSKRYGYPLSIIALDIDHFKTINDTFGHPVGDEVLKSLVFQSKTLLRSSDIFGRIGGEEFSIILPQTDLQGGWEIAIRLRTRLSQSVVKTIEGQVTYTISAGVSVYQPEDRRLEGLLKRADSALYLAKEKGRNRVEKM